MSDVCLVSGINIDCIEIYNLYNASSPLLLKSSCMDSPPNLLLQWVISRQVNVTPLILLQTSLSFLAYLEKQDKISEDNLTLLEDLCKKIVPNLMRKIDKYKREKGN